MYTLTKILITTKSQVKKSQKIKGNLYEKQLIKLATSFPNQILSIYGVFAGMILIFVQVRR
jgi:hypothetical protein